MWCVSSREGLLYPQGRAVSLASFPLTTRFHCRSVPEVSNIPVTSFLSHFHIKFSSLISQITRRIFSDLNDPIKSSRLCGCEAGRNYSSTILFFIYTNRTTYHLIQDFPLFATTFNLLVPTVFHLHWSLTVWISDETTPL